MRGQSLVYDAHAGQYLPCLKAHRGMKLGMVRRSSYLLQTCVAANKTAGLFSHVETVSRSDGDTIAPNEEASWISVVSRRRALWRRRLALWARWLW